MKKIILALFFITIIAAAVIALRKEAAVVPSERKTEISYACNGGKTISAIFTEGAELPPAPDGRPQPSGKAEVKLSDGRVLTLAQTISADGVRYANEGETFVFWSKGNGALVLEDDREKSYIGCVAVAPDPGTLPQVYQDGASGFSVRYPSGYAADASYHYLGLGEEWAISGVKFTIPASLAEGTNLGADSYVSVETLPLKEGEECVASRFLPSGAEATTREDGGTTYSVASSTDAGAGNRYEEIVYALPGTAPCIAVRSMIHYAVFENYPEGSIRRFDRDALVSQFDAIRRSLTVI